jgi:hypothetical protein
VVNAQGYVQLGRRERPKLLLDKHTGEPTMLYNGVGSTDGHVFTIATPMTLKTTDEDLPPLPLAAGVDAWPADGYGMFVPVQSGRSLAELVPVYRAIAATKRRHGVALPIVVQAEPCCFPLYRKEVPPNAPADYLPAVQSMRDAGVTVLWYVPTLNLAREKHGEYCCSPLSMINNWTDAALRFHAATHTGTMLDGVFFDNGPANQFQCAWGPCSNYTIYSAMYRHVQASAPSPRPVVMNSGLSYFDEHYMSLPGLMMLAFESSASTWAHKDWVLGGREFNWSKYPRSHFAMVTEGVANLSAAVATIEHAAALHYGYFHVTDATADYSKLPPYWEAMAQHISGMNVHLNATATARKTDDASAYGTVENLAATWDGYFWGLPNGVLPAGPLIGKCRL